MTSETQAPHAQAKRSAASAGGRGVKAAPAKTPKLLLDDDETQIRLIDVLSKPPGVHPNSVVLAALGAIVLAMLGFLPLSLPDLTGAGLQQLVGGAQAAPPPNIDYTLQLPVALFLGGLLGRFMGGLSVGLFLAAGFLAYPVFANGGGLDYVHQPGFGYLAGMGTGAVLAGWWMQRAFCHAKPKQRTLSLYTSGAVTVLAVHLAGLAALLISAWPAGATSWGVFWNGFWPIFIDNWSNWAMHLSLEPLPYDLLAATVLLWFVRYVRLALYPVLY